MNSLRALCLSFAILSPVTFWGSSEIAWSGDRVIKTTAQITRVEESCRIINPSAFSPDEDTDSLSCVQAYGIVERDEKSAVTIQRRSVADIEFESIHGDRVETAVVLDQNRIYFVGDEITISYLSNNPTHIIDAQRGVSDRSTALTGTKGDSASVRWLALVLLLGVGLTIVVLSMPSFRLPLRGFSGGRQREDDLSNSLESNDLPPRDLANSGSGFYGPARRHFGSRHP